MAAFLKTVSIMKLIKKITRPVLIALFWLAVWQGAALIINQELLLPTPKATVSAFLNMLSNAQFYLSVLLSLLRIISGYILGVLTGFTGAVLSYKFAFFKSVFSPALKVIKAVPVASFIILALVWFKGSTLPVFISFLMVLPMVWDSVENGLKNINNRYLEVAKIYKIKPLKVFFKIKLPFIFPSFISTALTALGFAWKSGIAAEVICRTEISLGNMLQTSKLYLEIPQVFAVTATVALLSLLLELIVKRLLRRNLVD